VLVTTALFEPKRAGPKGPSLSLADIMRGRFYDGVPIAIARASVRRARFARLGPAAPPPSTIDLEASRIVLGRGFAFSLDSLHATAPAPGRFHAADRSRARRVTARRPVRDAPARARSPTSTVGGALVWALDARDSVGDARFVLHATPVALDDIARLVPGVRRRRRGARRSRPSRHTARPAVGHRRGGVRARRFGGLALGRSALDANVVDGRADTHATAELLGMRAEANGWVRPLDQAPTYDVHIDATPLAHPPADARATLAQRAGLTARLDVRGAGFAPAAFDVRGDADGAAGHLSLDGRLDLARGVAWNVRRLAFERLDVARLTGDTTACSLTGTLGVVGLGRDGCAPPPRHGACRARSLPLRRVAGRSRAHRSANAWRRFRGLARARERRGSCRDRHVARPLGPLGRVPRPRRSRP
jgi:hypothetical protein